MKNKLIKNVVLGTGILASLLFFGCDELIDILQSEDLSTNINYPYKPENIKNKVVTATDELTWTYNSLNPIVEVNSSVKKLTVSGAPSGKTVYLVQANPGMETISENYVRNVKSSAGLVNDVTSQTSRNVVEDEQKFVPPLPPEMTRQHFVMPELPDMSNFRNFTRAASRSILDDTGSVPAVKVGKSKELYIDVNADINRFEKAKATCQATGQYCNVWVVDKYFTDSLSLNSSNCKVNKTIAEKYRDKFEEMYLVIREIFGEEAEILINYDNNSIEKIPDTDNKVNIVVYDIAGDFSPGKSSGTVGYFHSKDYFINDVKPQNYSFSRSNKGKYFYVDSGFAVSFFDETISTLAHEFQHMINFNQKEINSNFSMTSDTGYNEMLSMLCEDMMQSYLGLKDENSPKLRTRTFNMYHYLSGTTEYRRDGYSIISYATNYMFGAWLARQYGGAELVAYMSRNEYVNRDSIVHAVNDMNGTTYTFDFLFKQYLLAMTGSTKCTLKKNAELYSLDYGTSYRYPMTAFDIFSDTYKIGNVVIGTQDGTQVSFANYYGDKVYSGYNFHGPAVWSNSVVMDIRPDYGFSIHGISKVKSSYADVVLNFSETGAENLKMYVIIQ